MVCGVVWCDVMWCVTVMWDAYVWLVNLPPRVMKDSKFYFIQIPCNILKQRGSAGVKAILAIFMYSRIPRTQTARHYCYNYNYCLSTMKMLSRPMRINIIFVTYSPITANLLVISDVVDKQVHIASLAVRDARHFICRSLWRNKGHCQCFECAISRDLPKFDC